jgi:glutathione S-transferase
MKLYDLDLSGNCYKVRLFLSLIQTPLDLVPVDLMKGEHKEEKILQLNPWGQVPILEDGKVILRDAQAILVYLANKYGGEAWWPGEAHLQAEVMQWLSVASNEIQHGPNKARLVKKFGLEHNYDQCVEQTSQILTLIDTHLVTNNWLAANRPTIADCAIYPYISVAHEGDVTIDKYPNIQAWMARLKQLPGYISMPGN